MQVFSARHVLPVTEPPLADGAVAVEAGTIVAVGPRPEILRRFRGAELRDLGAAALLPGLVNAHCHVELSWMAADPPPGGDYTTWVRGLLERRGREDADVARRAAQSALDGMVARGTVALGDVANGTWVLPLLRASPLCGVAFHELYGGWGEDAEQRLRGALGRLAEAGTRGGPAEDRWRVVPAPHAPHTTSEPLLRLLARRAAERSEPLSVHVAESAAELALLANGSGPLLDLLRERSLLDAGWRPPGRTPVEHLDRLGALVPRTLAVHCVHVGPSERAILLARGAHVVTCPRSNERLGVGVAPVPSLLADGIAVALGTDSLASAPDLDLFAEMAALRRLHPRLSPTAVLRMATLGGAEALGLADRVGSIRPGRRAALVVVPIEPDDDPLEALCAEPPRVWQLEDAPCVEAG